jgi:inner membrane protein
MDNLAHSLVGLTLAKAGLERASPYATTVCVLAANAPDVDVLTRLRGNWFALEHHRGITHSIVGVLALGVLLPLIAFVIERIAARVGHVERRIRLPGLIIVSIIACATHPLLDWLNSYGLRPFLPWSARWYYGDLLFIFDPWLWLILGSAAFLLTARTRWRVGAWSALALIVTVGFLLLTQRAAWSFVALAIWVVGLVIVVWAHRAGGAARFGARVAQIALALVVCYIAALALVHQRAQAQATQAAAELARTHDEMLQRVAAMPMAADPTNWLAVAETDRATYRFQVHVPARAALNEQTVARFEKPQGADAAQVARAEQDARAQIFLGFARFPVMRVQTDEQGALLVRFADVRFSPPDTSRRPARGTFALDVHVPRAEQ